jgi:hypothetical protein
MKAPTEYSKGSYKKGSGWNVKREGGYRDVLSNILFPSSEEKQSLYDFTKTSNILFPSSEEKLSLNDVTKTSLQHYAPPPSLRAAHKTLGERKKEKNNS